MERRSEVTLAALLEYRGTATIAEMSGPPVLPLGYASPPSRRPFRPLALFGIAGTIVFAGIFVGASTNAINGVVSPDYFVSVMGWQLISGIWWASIRQGILEGAVVGLILSAVFTTAFGIITRGTGGYETGMRWVGGILVVDYCLWGIGGICGMGLASLKPQFFRNTFMGVPGDGVPMLRYAWVGGSIWGAEFGGLLAVVVGLILFRVSWRRMLKRESGSED